jgi:DNA-binding Lrp family transcriptional regulator
MKAYILVQTALGKTGTVLKALRAEPGVESADAVTGPYDVIAVMEADDFRAITELVTRDLHSIEGIERTLTCLAIEFI